MKFSLKDKIVEVIKKDTVLVIAAILAVISMFLIRLQRNILSL